MSQTERFQASPYVVAVLLVFGATVLTGLFNSLLSPITFTLFYASVAITAWFGGMKPGLFTIILSTLSSSFFFLTPVHSFAIANLEKFIQLALVMGVAFLVTFLISTLRNTRSQVEQLSNQKLQEREEQLQLALQAAQIGMWNWNLVTDEINWTPEHEQLFGLISGSFDGRYETFDACLHPDDREKLSHLIQVAIQEHSIYQHEYRIIWPDGSIHWVEARGQTFYDEIGQPVRMTGTIMNIDDRKRMEIALKQSEQQFRAIFEAEPECIKVVTTDGILRNMNPAGLAMIEVDRLEQVVGQSVCPLIDSAYQQAFLDFTQQVAQGTTAILKFEMTGLQGTHRWLESHAVPLHTPDETDALVLMVTRDVTERKLAEAALQESERSLSTLMDNLPGYVYRAHNDPNYTPEFVSEGVFEITGYRQEEYLVDRTIACGQAIHPDDAAAVWKRVQQAIVARQPYECTYRIITKSGIPKWVWERGRGIYTEAGELRCLEGFVTDITDRKQAEIALEAAKLELEQRVVERTIELQQSNDLLNNFFNAASSAAIGLCIHDRDLRFVKINEALAAINGHSVAEHLGKTTAELLPELAPIVTPLHQQVLNTGQAILNREIVSEVPSQPGAMRYWLASYFPILSSHGSTQPVGVGVIIIEISNHKQAESVLLESDRRWRSLLDNVQLIVVGLNQDGTVEYINPFFLQLTGYTSEEVLGKHWFNHFLPQGQILSTYTSFQEVLSKEFHPHYQNSIVTKSGEERMIAWSNTLLRNTTGQPIGTVSIGEDVTERYRLERMKAEFISIVSHELRTPLTSISGALELLSTGLIQPNSERGQETIAIAATEADRLTRLVNDILDLERLESGKVRLEYRAWNLAELMRRAVDFMQFTANQAAIRLFVEPLSMTLHIDGDRILQVLTNLLSNAIKFSPNGSTVELTARICGIEAAQEQTPSVSSISSTIASLPYLLITVRDQGRGIPTNKLESIFERFQQVDASDSRKKGGTGLGLAICRNIVQQHGGNIWVESTVERGSQFHFTLPLTTEHRPNDAQTDSAD